jgi:hypothetical protein
MRYRLCILLIIFTGGITFGQKVKTHQKTREVIINSGDSIIVTNILLDQDKIKPELKYTYYWYLRNKINHNVGNFSGKLLDGKYQVFVQDKLMLSGFYKEGKRTGKWISWNNDGSVKTVSTYADGVIEISQADNPAKHGIKHFLKKDKSKKRTLRLFHKKDKTKETGPAQP